MQLTRRQFTGYLTGSAGLIALGPLGHALATRNAEMNILCWEG